MLCGFSSSKLTKGEIYLREDCSDCAIMGSFMKRREAIYTGLYYFFYYYYYYYLGSFFCLFVSKNKCDAVRVYGFCFMVKLGKWSTFEVSPWQSLNKIRKIPPPPCLKINLTKFETCGINPLGGVRPSMRSENGQNQPQSQICDKMADFLLT